MAEACGLAVGFDIEGLGHAVKAERVKLKAIS
jgi:hypothetical protein